MLDSIDSGLADAEIAEEFNVGVEDVRLIRRVLRE
jgi:orotate phosphoribosyltransferase-like protein